MQTMTPVNINIEQNELMLNDVTFLNSYRIRLAVSNQVGELAKMQSEVTFYFDKIELNWFNSQLMAMVSLFESFDHNANNVCS